MTRELADGCELGARLQQMDCSGVPKRMGMNASASRGRSIVRQVRPATNVRH
jgi:hypothetical protein